MRIGHYKSSEGTDVGTAVTFFLIGLGAGALAGLLLAPKSGKQLRRDIKRGYEDAKDAVGEWADEAAENVKERVRGAGERVRDAANRGIDAATDLAGDVRDAAREKTEPIRRAINRG
ncbi:MAG TPA: YtxH domain-containing protein [Candidatus Acidoferrales bacterium]|nr:YtxH domain-containing protein [Candidatus Acidoferrales bacterium]